MRIVKRALGWGAKCWCGWCCDGRDRVRVEAAVSAHEFVHAVERAA
jgi:hypothetical protein